MEYEDNKKNIITIKSNLLWKQMAIHCINQEQWSCQGSQGNAYSSPYSNPDFKNKEKRENC